MHATIHFQCGPFAVHVGGGLAPSVALLLVLVALLVSLCAWLQSVGLRGLAVRVVFGDLPFSEMWEALPSFPH